METLFVGQCMSYIYGLLEDGFNLLHPVVLHNITISCSLESKIIELQKIDVGIFHIKRKMQELETKHFILDERGVLWFGDQLVVLKDCELRNQNLDEAHSSKLSIHSGSSKMYQDLKTHFWWTKMKRKSPPMSLGVIIAVESRTFI